MAFHLFLVCATIRVVVLVFCSNVPAIGLARFVLVHGLQTCRVSDFCCFCQFGIALRRYLSYSRPRTCRFSPSAVFRSSLSRFSVFHNGSQRRRYVISLTLPFALGSPWKGPLELSLCSVTLYLALRMNRLKVCPFFHVSCLGCT